MAAGRLNRMDEFEQSLEADLEDIQSKGLHRRLRRMDSPQCPHLCCDGREVLNLASNDYLGFANHPRLKEAVVQTVAQYGAGAGASRLICGSLAPHHAL